MSVYFCTAEPQRERELTGAIADACVFQVACSRKLKQLSLLDTQTPDLLATVVSLLDKETQAHRVTVPYFRHRSAAVLRRRRCFSGHVAQALRHLLEIRATLVGQIGRANRTN